MKGQVLFLSFVSTYIPGIQRIYNSLFINISLALPSLCMPYFISHLFLIFDKRSDSVFMTVICSHDYDLSQVDSPFEYHITGYHEVEFVIGDRLESMNGWRRSVVIRSIVCLDHTVFVILSDLRCSTQMKKRKVFSSYYRDHSQT